MRPLEYSLELEILKEGGQLRLTKKVLGMTEIWKVWESYHRGDAGTKGGG